MATTITPTRRAPAAPSSPRWLRWPADRVPTRPGTFLVARGHSGKCIAVGLAEAGGDFVAFDAHCFHHGAALWSDADAMGGDIEDGAVVVCPAHGRRIDVRTGACAGAGRAQRTYACRATRRADGGVDVDVDVARGDGACDSDAYNCGESPAVVRSRRARNSVTPERATARRLAYETDDDDDDDDDGDVRMRD